MRDAILKAADQIESSPSTFDFHTVDRPDLSCGTPGCALGWIGFFANVKTSDRMSFVSATAAALGVDSMYFYERLDQCCDSEDWMNDPALCAKALRAYADAYYPA